MWHAVTVLGLVLAVAVVAGGQDRQTVRQSMRAELAELRARVARLEIRTATESNAVVDLIRVRKLELVGRDGTVRGAMDFKNGAPRMWLHGLEHEFLAVPLGMTVRELGGDPRITLLVYPHWLGGNHAGLYLQGADGKGDTIGVLLNSSQHGHFKITDSAGETVAALPFE